MAFFMDPGAMFLGSLDGTEQKYILEVLKGARKSGYTRVVEPCAGTFALSNLAIQAGFKASQIESSDVNMMSTVMGYAVTGQPLDSLHIHAAGFSDEELLDPAVALYAQLYLRTSKNAGTEYYHNLLRDLKDRREYHVETVRSQLEAIRGELGGMNYRALDMWEHLKEVKDDPDTVIVLNPPTYFAGYEKFYDTQGKMTWDEPPYAMFDPIVGHKEIYDMMRDAPALILIHQEIQAGQTAFPAEFARGKKIKRPNESKLEPLKCSILPSDYEITEKSKIQVIPVTGATSTYYRMIWTHNFVGSQATYNRALLIDGYVAAVFGISKMSADSVFVWYVMKAPHKVYRLGRLCYMLAQNREFVDGLLNEFEKEKVTKMRTAMLTKYAENKEVRGIMKLVSRQTDKVNGYKLTYEADLVKGRNEKQTLAEWLRREQKWQQSRANQ